MCVGKVLKVYRCLSVFFIGIHLDNEISSLLAMLKVFYKNKGKGTPKQNLWLIVQVKFVSFSGLP